MTTINPRVNVTMDPYYENVLRELAKDEQKSVSTLSRELIVEALEMREDRWLSAIAAERDKSQKNKKTYSHKDAWR